MIIVTGGAGFIGSNIVKGLNERGREDILVVDDLTDGAKFRNLADCEILDFIDKDDFIATPQGCAGLAVPVEAVFHQGACSSTTEQDGRYLMKNNYAYSRQLLQFCLENQAAFLYASSASVYGGGDDFGETRENEAPLNVYGYSKFLFDQQVRRILPRARSQVAGFRYFNVYGPREQHKGDMASVAWHFSRQLDMPVQTRASSGAVTAMPMASSAVILSTWTTSWTSISGSWTMPTNPGSSISAPDPPTPLMRSPPR